MLHKHSKNILSNPIKVIYSIEYTEEKEISPDFENIKKVNKIESLEDLIYTMFMLREKEKNNIDIGYTITDINDNWIIEDYAVCCEGYTSTVKEKEQKIKLNKQAELITALSKENELMREFLVKYNALDRFNQEMKGGNPLVKKPIN
jgi:hypothetical protein